MIEAGERDRRAAKRGVDTGARPHLADARERQPRDALEGEGVLGHERRRQRHQQLVFLPALRRERERPTLPSPIGWERDQG